MTIQEAIRVLDGVIPAPQNKMVDADHAAIAFAWQRARTALLTAEDTQERLDTMMKRWHEQVETIRCKIDAGTLTYEDRRLLDALNLPHQYDRRPRT